MSRRRHLSIWLVALAIAGLFGLASQAQTDSADLAAKVAQLEQRLANLEKTLNSRLTAIERRVASGGSSPQLEQEASTAYAEIARLRNAGDYDDAKTKLAEFMKTYGATRVAQRARRDVQELAVIGKTAPTDWAIDKWFQGEDQIDLTSDKATLVVFWEVWCPHCKREVPKLDQMYTELKGEGLQVVGFTQINKSATEQKVADFIAQSKVSYPIAKTQGSINSYFNVGAIPAAAVVKNGKIVWRGHPGQLNAQTLRRWL